MIIMEFGSANTCGNNLKIVQKMIDGLARVDKDRKCIIKWQLFKKAGFNKVLNQETFDFAYTQAGKEGFQTTASVFDEESLKFLTSYKIPFVKIANVSGPYEWFKPLKKLATKCPIGTPLYISYTNEADLPTLAPEDRALFCVSEYPADIEKYNTRSRYISDHTVGLELYKKIKPVIWEKHFRLPDSTGPDAGPFAILPSELKTIL